MKKLFTLALALFCGLGAMAEDYTDQLALIRNGETVQEQEKVATLTRLDNGQYKLEVDNLVLEAAGLGIGNVVIDSIDAVDNPDEPGVIDLGTSQKIRITSGTASGYPVWIGPRIGAVSVDLEGKVGGDKLYFKATSEASFYGTDFKGEFIFGNIQSVVESAATGIESASASTPATAVAAYDLAGRRVSELRKGQTYIVHMSDGTVRKALR